MIASYTRAAPQSPYDWFNKIGGEEANMTIDSVDWTIQETQHLKVERREPSNFNDKSSLGKLLGARTRTRGGGSPRMVLSLRLPSRPTDVVDFRRGVTAEPKSTFLS